ncbi:butyrophilin subfamily 2 member A2-like [Discoglossus pictus]
MMAAKLSVFPILIILLPLQLFKPTYSVLFDVVTSRSQVIASVGSDALLPCHLSPSISAQNMEIRWIRSSFQPYVHLYLDFYDNHDKQMEEFEGRTQLITEDIKTGKIALVISNVKLSDEGKYKCFFRADDRSDEAQVELKVTVTGVHPSIWITGYSNGKITVECESDGWYPEPVWRNRTGNISPKSVDISKKQETGLFLVKTVFDIDQASNILCSVKNEYTSEEKESSIKIKGKKICYIVIFVLLLLERLLEYQREENERLLEDQREENGKLCGEIETLRGKIEILHEDLDKHVKENDKHVEEKKIVTEGLGKCVKETDLFKCCLQATHVFVTLDEETAHPCLKVTGNGKYVMQDAQLSPGQKSASEKRFTGHSYVLGKEAFTSGKYFWEVDITDPCCSLGVARESVSRKGCIPIDPQEGIFAIKLYEESNKKIMNISNNDGYIKLKVYIDYEGETLTVLRVDTLKHITQKFNFNVKILPFFEVETKSQIKL